MDKDQLAKRRHTNIDHDYNAHRSRNLVSRLPKPLSHFLGYRDAPPKDLRKIFVAAWALVGAFGGVVVLEAFFMIPRIRHLQSPVLITSFVSASTLSYVTKGLIFTEGAAAILEFNAIQTPLAQPRNSIVGHIVSTTIGISIAKLFKLGKDFENKRWLAGGLGCGSASAVMTLTGSIYPPAGATALQASVDPKTEQLGWYLLPLVLLCSVITLVTSLIINNIQRRFPVYWWTPVTLSQEKKTDDIEKMSTASQISEEVFQEKQDIIMIAGHCLDVPEHIILTDEEKRVVEALRNRLRPSFSQSCRTATPP